MFSWPGAISMTLGGGALSKVMASKWFAGWLKSYPITRSPTDPRIAQHLNRLYALSSESLGLDKESAQQLKDALLPGKANALFVGEQGAKPSDKITLEQAQQMQKKNEDPGKIWAETGWTQGDEGKWKFELDDHDAALTEKSMAALDTAREGKGVVEVPLGQVLDHPHLFDYYPEAENIKVVFGTTKTYPEGIRANDWWASQSGNRIAVNANHEDFNENELTLSILHEVQHWLAVKNKFRYGGGKKVPYEDIPGERQSQEVEERKDLSYEERRAKRPTMQLGGPSPEGNKQEVGPTPEERGFLAPLVKPRGSSEFELGVPGIVKWPYDAAKRLMSDEGQYRPGTQDEAGVRDAMTAASATGAGALATRPASSLGTFAGRTAFQPRVSGKFSGIGAAPEVKASVLEQYKNGVPVRRIALDHGLTQYDVRKLAVKHGVGRDVRAPRAPDFWNEGRIAEAVDLRNRGKTHDQIAQHFGMKAENIASMFSRRGLSKKQPAPEVGRNRPSETPLDREAMSVEQEARSIEAAAGSPDEAAKAINERFGGNTTADDIKKGNVWWKVDEPRELSGMPSHDAWDTSRIYAAGAPTQGPDAGDRGVHKVVFTGESSKTADKEALAKAKDMDGQADPSKIWQRTGWYKSKDGEWNNEIDDSQAKFKIDPSLVAGRKPTDYLETTLGKVIDHPGLFAAHPHLSSMPIRLYNANELPDEGGGASTMLPSKSNPRGYIELPIGSTDPDDMGILLHEINHALEPENNFDYGPFEGKYKNRQGEVKARNVQTRQEMTAEQRRKSYPPSTEDIKWPRVLVRSKEQRRLSETADDEDNIHAAHLP
jgi:hypothetical protein